ncbi:MAG: glycosyltransferase, partial [Planctomycetota bacterium]
EPAPEDAEAFAALAAARRDGLVEAVNGAASRVLLPAAFMRPWFEALGVRSDLLHVETTGVDWEGARRFERERRAPGEPVRVLFLGTLAPHKGAHVLADAWGRLPEDVRASARLRVHGPAPGGAASPYLRDLEQRAAPLGVEIGGRLTRDEVRREMARTDVLVAPSLWLEIRPLVMLEAYAAGARVIATDLGGMAEAVRDGLPGTLFPEGDAEALAGALRAEIERARRAGDEDPLPEPSALFRGWADVASALERHYAELVDRGGVPDRLGSR